MSNQEIISQTLTLPLADRLFIVNQIVESINPMDNKIENQWIEEVKAREKLLEIGKLETVSYKEFFGED
jgi:hypothetical protein